MRRFNQKARQRLFLLFITTLLAFSMPACLKTRSQIQQDEQNDQGLTNPPPKGQHYEIDEMKDDLTQLSGRVDEIEHNQQNQDTSDIKQQITQLGTRVDTLEKNQIVVMTELKELKQLVQNESAAAARVAAAVPASSLISEGRRLLREKKYDAAISKFRTALRKGLKRHTAADVHYDIGDAEYAQKHFKKAILEYSKVQQVDSKSSRIPASLYRIGLSFEHLGMTKEAKGFFSELTERYPHSREARHVRTHKR